MDPLSRVINFRSTGVIAFFVVIAVMLSPRPTPGGEKTSVNLPRDIRSLFKSKCGACHWDDPAESRLRLTSIDDIMIGGEGGPAVRPGKPNESLLWRKIADGQMPPKDEPALTDVEKTKIRRWIQRGRFPSRDAVRRAETKRLRSQALKHWAFRPIVAPEVPEVKKTTWPRSEIDWFILDRLEAKGLHPVGDADPYMLIRRVHYDLIGLPPSPEEITRLMKRNVVLHRRDRASSSRSAGLHPALLAEMVDRLLASPKFGECWGRHWLDVARYSDTLGGGANFTLNDAWRYRDYVIGSFNKDKPYDRFVIEQIAGDLLPSTTPSERQEQLTATGFLAIGPKDFTDQDKVKLLADVIDEQMDTLGKAFLGLTLGCARCHGHKFDPVPIEDYYSLAGIFRSTQTLEAMDDTKKFANMPSWNRIPLPRITPGGHSDFLKRFKAEQAALDRRSAGFQARIVELQKRKRLLEDGAHQAGGIARNAKAIQQIDVQIAEAERRKAKVVAEKKGRATLKNYFGEPYPSILGVLEGKAPADARIDLHGNPHQPGPVVPRGVLRAFGRPCSPIASNQSGRLQLARWLTDSQHPLTARVMVNRVWSHLLGRGIVASTDNFGTRGRRPTHPKLLDYLAVRFMTPIPRAPRTVGPDGYGWSVKKLIRQIMLSRVYQLASRGNRAAESIDPDNTLFWKRTTRRLGAEALHDSILAIGGQLDERRGGPSLIHSGTMSLGFRKSIRRRNLWKRRSVYLPVYRSTSIEQTAMLSTFDFADPNFVVGHRNASLVPTQALYLMNNDLVIDCARSFAGTLLKADTEDEVKINRAYLSAFGRPVTAAERLRAKKFINMTIRTLREKNNPKTARQTAWISFCQVLFSGSEFLFVN